MYLVYTKIHYEWRNKTQIGYYKINIIFCSKIVTNLDHLVFKF